MKSAERMKNDITREFQTEGALEASHTNRFQDFEVFAGEGNFLHECEEWSVESGVVSKATLNKCCSDSNCKNSTFHSQLSKFKGFTLAEVLITLAVVGVVAAITMPVLMTNINERVNSERQANIAYKVTQAMEQMRAHGKLTTYASTDAFVDELQKYLKITKRCDANNIAECWPVETVTDGQGEEYNVSDAKKRKNLLPNATTGNADDDNVGLILADGASIILTYDNSKEPVDVGTRVTTIMKENSKGQKIAYTIKPTTESIDFVMDVNGKRKPNTEGKDIKSFSIASFAKSGPACDEGPQGCLYLVPTYSPVNCSSTNSGSDDYKNYCGPHPSGYSDDYWAGANKVCAEAGMTLPTLDKLKLIYAAKGQYTGSNANIATSTLIFWSSLGDNADHSWYVYFYDGEVGFIFRHYPEAVLCLGD